MAELVSQAEFARRLGVAKSYITKLKQQGRIVMRDGKVDVQASLALLRQSRDPARAGAAAEALDDETVSASYARAKAVRERYLALKAKAEYEQMMGRLVPTDEVRAAGREMGAILRAELEALPDRLAAELAAERDPAAVHAMLEGAVRQALERAAHALEEALARALDTDQGR